MDIDEVRPGGSFRLAWSTLLVIAFALVVVGVVIFYIPERLRLGRLVGVGVAGVGLFSLFLTWYGVRDGSRLAIETMWTLPVVLTGAAGAFLIGDRILLAIVSTATAGLASLMLLVARNRLS